jgi:hypothetical protein
MLSTLPTTSTTSTKSIVNVSKPGIVYSFELQPVSTLRCAKNERCHVGVQALENYCHCLKGQCKRAHSSCFDSIKRLCGVEALEVRDEQTALEAFVLGRSHRTLDRGKYGRCQKQTTKMKRLFRYLLHYLRSPNHCSERAALGYS